MAISTHASLRKLGLFWKKDEKETGLHACFRQPNGRGYRLTHKEGAIVLLTSYDSNIEAYRWYLVTPYSGNRRSKAVFATHELARDAAEAFALANMDIVARRLEALK